LFHPCQAEDVYLTGRQAAAQHLDGRLSLCPNPHRCDQGNEQNRQD